MLNSWHFHKKEQTGWYLPCAFPSPVLSAWARGVGRAVCTRKGVHTGRTLCWTSTKLHRPVTSTTVKTWDISMTPTKLRGISINSVLHCSQYPPHAGNWGFTFCHERLVLCSVPDTRNHAVHICCAWLLSHSEPCGWDASMVVIHAFPPKQHSPTVISLSSHLLMGTEVFTHVFHFLWVHRWEWNCWVVWWVNVILWENLSGCCQSKAFTLHSYRNEDSSRCITYIVPNFWDFQSFNF